MMGNQAQVIKAPHLFPKRCYWGKEWAYKCEREVSCTDCKYYVRRK